MRVRQPGAVGWHRQALDAFLHPRDSLLTSLELPPLPGAKTAAAVACAAQALILGPWNRCMWPTARAKARARAGGLGAKAGLERLAQVLRAGPLKLRGLYPAPYALPVGAAALTAIC
jgi:general secretion pathway protein L